MILNMGTWMPLAILFVAFAGISCQNVVSLPAYNADIHKTSVSGLSSGGFMAVQLHVAYSSIIMGAGKQFTRYCEISPQLSDFDKP